MLTTETPKLTPLLPPGAAGTKGDGLAKLVRELMAGTASATQPDLAPFVSLARELPMVVVVIDVVDPLDPDSIVLRYANPVARQKFGTWLTKSLDKPLRDCPESEFHGIKLECIEVAGTTMSLGLGELTIGASKHFDGHIVLGHLFALGGCTVGFCAEDISEIKQAEAKLRTTADALARSNADLDDFAYIASHDLREPLRGIRSYATFMVEDYAETLDEEGQRKLQRMGVLCERLDTLLDSLLRYSRVGRAELSIVEADLDAAVTDVVERLEERLTRDNIEVLRPMRLPTVRCDAVRVTEVFYNLILNAAKYNDKDERTIEIGVLERHPKAPRTPVFYVKDNGIGIRDKHREAVFQIFKRLNGRDKFGGGTGSGLTLTQKIVERHGGKIWVESVFREGATFLFTLEDPGT